MLNRTLLLLWLILCACAVHSQSNFNYAFTQNSDPYVSLSGATELFAGQNWDEEETIIGIGFSFTFLGATFDSVNVNTDGLLAFDEQYHYVAAGNYFDLSKRSYANGTASKIQYKLEGGAGTRILKIEFDKAHVYEGAANDQVSFQIWLHEGSNKVSYHYGSSSITDLESTYEDNGGPTVGILKMSGNGLQLTGAAQAATATPSTGGAQLYLTGTPTANTIYEFTPQ